MRKPAFCICENKDADTAKLISVFVFATQIVQSLYFLNTNFKPLAIFCGCTAQFVSELVGNPEDRFSHNEAQLSLVIRKPAFCLCENKGTNQLHSNYAAEQHLWFCYVANTNPQLSSTFVFAM